MKNLNDRNIPIIMMTLYEYVQSMVKGLQPTIIDFLFKPITRQMFTVALARKRVNLLPPYTDTVQVSIRSRMAAIDHVVLLFQRRVARFCQLYHLTPVNMSVCLREALANAIIHGNLEISSTLKEESWERFEALVQEREVLPELAERQVLIRCQMTLEHLRFEIEDQGQGFDRSAFQLSSSKKISPLEDGDPMQTLPKSGRGLCIITAFMDTVFWNDAGNCITMMKYLQTAKL